MHHPCPATLTGTDRQTQRVDLDLLTEDLTAELDAYTRGGDVRAEHLPDLAHHVTTWLRDRRALRDDPSTPLLYVLSDAIDPMEPTICESLTEAKVAARSRTARLRRVKIPTGDTWTVFTAGTVKHHRWRHTHEGRVVADYLIEEVALTRL